MKHPSLAEPNQYEKHFWDLQHDTHKKRIHQIQDRRNKLTLVATETLKRRIASNYLRDLSQPKEGQQHPLLAEGNPQSYHAR